MTLPTKLAALVTLGTLFVAPAVFGQNTGQSSQPSSQSTPTATQADFDACNKQAAAQAEPELVQIR